VKAFALEFPEFRTMWLGVMSAQLEADNPVPNATSQRAEVLPLWRSIACTGALNPLPMATQPF
jgi:hypothetical protein